MAEKQQDLTFLSPVVRDLDLKRVDFDIRGALGAGLKTRDMVEGIIAQPDVDPRWQRFVTAARQEGMTDDDLLAEITGASPDIRKAMVELGGRGLGRGAAASVGAVKGGKVGATIGAGLGPGGALVGGFAGTLIGGGLAYFAADSALEAVLGEPTEYTPKARTYGIGAETVGEIAGTIPAYVRYLPRAGRSIQHSYERAARERAAAAGREFNPEDVVRGKVANFLIRTGESIERNPRIYQTIMSAEAVGAGVFAGAAQAAVPENPWVRMGAEVGGGVTAGLAGATGLTIGGRLLPFAVDRIRNIGTEAFSDQEAARLVLLNYIAQKEPDFNFANFRQLPKNEQIDRLLGAARDIETQLDSMLPALREAGLENPKAIDAIPELRSIARSMGRSDEVLGLRLDRMADEDIDKILTVSRALFADGDPDMVAASLLLRDDANRLIVQRMIDDNMAVADRFMARFGLQEDMPESTRTEIAQRFGSLLRAQGLKAKREFDRTAEYLYNEVVDKDAPANFTNLPNFFRQLRDPDSGELLVPAEELPPRITAQLNAFLTGAADPTEGVTVGDLIRFRAIMRQKAQSAADPNMARIYRQLNHEAFKDLDATEQLVNQMRLQYNDFNLGDQKLGLANSFYREGMDVFRRSFARQLLARDRDGAYRMPTERLIEAAANPTSPAARERIFDEILDMSQFMGRQVERLEAQGVSLPAELRHLSVPEITDIAQRMGVREQDVPSLMRGEMDNLFDLTLNRIARTAYDPATGTVNANRLQAFVDENPEFLSRAPFEIRELFEQTPAALRRLNVAMQAQRAGTPAARAKLVADEFTPIVTALVRNRTAAGVKIPDQVFVSSDQNMMRTLLESRDITVSPSRNLQDLIEFVQKGPESSNRILRSLREQGVNVEQAFDDPAAVKEGFISLFGRYVMGGEDGQVFSTAVQRALEPLPGGKRSAVDIMKANGILSADEVDQIKRVLQAAKQYEDLMKTPGFAGMSDIEQASIIGAAQDVAVRTLGSAMGGALARIMNDPNSLIARAAGSNFLRKMLNNAPVHLVKNQMAQMLFDPTPEKEFSTILRRFIEQPPSSEPAAIAGVSGPYLSSLGLFLFGPRMTTAQMRLLTSEPDERTAIEEQEVQQERYMAPETRRPRPEPQPQQPQQPPAPPHNPQPMNFDRFVPPAQPGQQPGAAPAGGAQLTPEQGAALAFPNDPTMQVAAQRQQPQGFAEGGAVTNPRAQNTARLAAEIAQQYGIDWGRLRLRDPVQRFAEGGPVVEFDQNYRATNPYVETYALPERQTMIPEALPSEAFANAPYETPVAAAPAGSTSDALQGRDPRLIRFQQERIVRSPQQTAREQIKDKESAFFDLLKRVENDREVGYDPRINRWKPHRSPEGGNDTIGWGHKLTDREVKNNSILIDGVEVSLDEGLTDDQVNSLLVQDFRNAEARAKRHFGDDWENMSREVQLLASEIAFNVRGGLAGFPTFTELASNPETERQAINEIGRTFTDRSGNVIPLTRRTNAIRQWFETTEDDMTELLARAQEVSSGSKTFRERMRDRLSETPLAGPAAEADRIYRGLMRRIRQRAGQR